MYQIVLDGRAQKDLDKLHNHNLRRIFDVLTTLQKTPRPRGCKKLRGPKQPTYRIRVGNYRVVYSIDDQTETITVWRVRHRKDVYRHR